MQSLSVEEVSGPSRRNSIASVLKGKKSKKGPPSNESTGSLASNDAMSAFDKLKNKTRTSFESTPSRRGSADAVPSNRLSALMSGRRKRKKSKNADLEQSNQSGSLLDITTVRTGSTSGVESPGGNGSEGSGLEASEGASLLTEDDSDDDRQVVTISLNVVTVPDPLPCSPPVRPSLSPHQSHVGYLTLSSPLIAAESVESNSAPDAIPKIAEPLSLDETLRQSSVTRDKSPSGISKLREAFVPTKRSTSATSNTEGDIPGPQNGTRATGETSTLPKSSNRPLAAYGSQTPKPINTSAPATPPNLAEAPTTLITPPTPTDTRPQSPGKESSTVKSQSPDTSNASLSSLGNMIAHRRVRSATNPPSKLSNAMAPPLTPTLEETKTPGGTITSPGGGGGFFSNMFSAAQTAANQLSNSINTTIVPGNRSRSGTGTSSETEKTTSKTNGEEPLDANPDSLITADVRRPLAIESIGTGNLSLSHLGIDEETSPMNSATDVSKVVKDEVAARAEDASAAKAISDAYSAPAPSPKKEKPSSMATAISMAKSSSTPGDVTPPRTSEPDLHNIKRSGSVRSRISGRRRRHRGSSATTGTTIAAAIGASTATLAHPGGQPGGPRLPTGFAVASARRNKDFHGLFRSVPEDDYLIEDYSAALQKDILLQGRLYVSEGHICFSSNILGWVTNLVISFDEIVSVEKKSTAVIFPNAIVIQTLHARNVFASFISRDSTYDLIIGIWRISHPNLKSSLNGVMLADDSGTGDKTEKADSLGSDDGSEEGTDDEVYDEDAEEEEGLEGYTDPGDGSIAGSDIGDAGKTVSRKTSAAAVAAGALGAGGTQAKQAEGDPSAVAGAGTIVDFPGPQTHAPTECGDDATHLAIVLTDSVIPAPLGKIYSLMFGPSSGAFMRRWLVDDQKSKELQMEDDKQGLGESKKTFTYSFIKPLYGSIGPKQTKCIVDQTLEQFDLEKGVTVMCSTQTPDVPSGNIFTTKTKYCLMWGPNNQTRLIMTCAVEWTGKSWLKGPIEKGANDGQITYAKDIVAALKAAVSKPTSKPATRTGKSGKARRKTQGEATETAAPVATTETKAPAKLDWGILEPLHGPLGPVVDILSPVLNMQVAVLVLAILVTVLWFRTSRLAHQSLSPYGAGRTAAYQELWQNQESELWSWLEERVGMDSAASILGQEGRRRESERETERRMQEAGGEMSERQVREAIRVTEERLRDLKEAIDRKASKGKKDKGKG